MKMLKGIYFVLFIASHTINSQGLTGPTGITASVGNPIDPINIMQNISMYAKQMSYDMIMNKINIILNDQNLNVNEKYKDVGSLLEFMLREINKNYPDRDSNTGEHYDGLLVNLYEPSIKLILEDRRIDFNSAPLEIWAKFIKRYIIDEENSDRKRFYFLSNLKLDQFIYKNFKNESWLQKSEIYPFLKLINDMLNKGFDKATAVAFLKIDQNNPPKDFKDKNLELIQKGYLFAKQNNFKEIGNLIRRYMTTLANSPQDIGNIIAQFEPKEHKLVSPAPLQKYLKIT